MRKNYEYEIVETTTRNEFIDALDASAPVISLGGDILDEMTEAIQKEKRINDRQAKIEIGANVAGLVAGFLIAMPIATGITLTTLISMKYREKKNEFDKYNVYICPPAQKESNETKVLLINRDAYSPKYDTVVGIDNTVFIHNSTKKCPRCNNKIVYPKDKQANVCFCGKCGIRFVTR